MAEINISYISLGHRCHINKILHINKVKMETYPFDNIITAWDGIIDCFENNFSHFFPKKIICEKVFIGEGCSETDASGNAHIFRGKYSAFTHHNLEDKSVIETFTKRIKRLDDFLQETHNNVLFCRTILDADEPNKHSLFSNTIKTKYPNLTFKVLYIYDNKYLPENIWKKNDYFVSNSVLETKDENNQTNPQKYKFLFEYLLNNNIFINNNLVELPEEIKLTNDIYKGWTRKSGIYPYDIDN